jgi:flagellar basal body P-ring protein FlgI
VADAINNSIRGNTAKALDAATIQVTVPEDRRKNMIEFIFVLILVQLEVLYLIKIGFVL